MTRVHIKSQNMPTAGASIHQRISTDTSPTPATATITPSPIPIRRAESAAESNDSHSNKQDVSAQQVTRDDSSNSRAPPQSRLSERIGSPDDSDNGPLSDHLDDRPSLAGKARLRIHFEDLTHPAVAKFLTVMPVSTLLQNAISDVQNHLFTPPGKHHSSLETSPDVPQISENPTATVFGTGAMSRSRPPPPQKPIHGPDRWTPQEVRSVTFVIRSKDGVAYTTGTELDSAHKEIHLSIQYIEHVMNSSAEKSDPDENFKFELKGVATHEMVHVFQHNAGSSCPGGLIEGIADYVRLKSGLGAKHWNPWPANKKSRGEKWDEGYQKTAWFLDWVEQKVGKGAIGKLNYEMRDRTWSKGDVWKDVMGHKVEDMWEKYQSSWEDMNRKHEKEEATEKN